MTRLFRITPIIRLPQWLDISDEVVIYILKQLL